LAYCSTCNAFFRDLPVSSFLFHSSLLTVKSVNLVVVHDGFLCIMGIFIVVTFSTEVLFKQFLICTCQTQLTEKGNGYQTITGVHGTIVYFRIVATLITDVLFKQFLICTAV